MSAGQHVLHMTVIANRFDAVDRAVSDAVSRYTGWDRDKADAHVQDNLEANLTIVDKRPGAGIRWRAECKITV